MPNGKKLLLVAFILAVAGVWGCSQPGGDSRTAARIRHLESRNTKLEEDYRAALDECVQLRKQLATAQQQCKTLQAQQAEFQTVRAERDDLQQRLTVSVSERDALLTQFNRFNQEVQALAGRLQQATGNRGNVPASTVSMQTEK
jgi:predicted nuclease with TOPRIM domain